MEKQSNLQLELFSKSKDSRIVKNQTSNNSFLTRIWNYEKTMLIIIGMVITSIISFSLGVERGRRLLTLKNDALLKQSTKEDKSKGPVSPKEQHPRIIIEKEETLTELVLPIEKRGYTIQLASYKTKIYAQKELELLKKKGFSPLLLSKGNYIVLCVGNFSSKETAQSILSELKKRYRDCYLRRL